MWPFAFREERRGLRVMVRKPQGEPGNMMRMAACHFSVLENMAKVAIVRTAAGLINVKTTSVVGWHTWELSSLGVSSCFSQ